MKAVFIRRHGSLDEVQVGELARPEPEAGEVLVRTRAAALNHLDLWVTQGIPGLHPAMPHVLGSDGAGVVEATGPGASRFAVGDAVMLNAVLSCGNCEFCLAGEQSLCIDLKLVGEHAPGTFAEFFRVPQENLSPKPEGVTFQQAAAFSLVFQTAWRMLHTRAGLQAGWDVFIHGIGGGVATAALAIAKLAGARVFVSSSSEKKLEQARRLGADFAYNYRSEDVVARVMAETDKRGVDLVVDNVGAATWLQSLRLVAKGGTVVTCGATSGANPETEIRLIFWKQIRILGSTMGNRREYRDLVRLLGRGDLGPAIDREFTLDEAPQALRYLASGRQFGKIVLTFS